MTPPLVSQEHQYHPESIGSFSSAYAGTKSKFGKLPPSVVMRRDRAAAKATDLGFPTTRSEQWRNSSLRPLLEKNYRFKVSVEQGEASLPDLSNVHSRLLPGAIQIVFVDGRLSLGLSDTRRMIPQISLKTLFEGEAAEERFFQTLDETLVFKSPFPYMASAVADHGLLIKVGPRPNEPIKVHILHIFTSTSEGASISSRVVLDADRLAEVQMVEEYQSIDSTSVHHNGLTQIVAHPGASVSYFKLSHIGESCFQTGCVTVSSEKNSKVDCFSFDASRGFSRFDLSLQHLDENTEICCDGLSLGRSRSHHDYSSIVDHVVSSSVTRQRFRAIAEGQAQSIFNGKIHIQRDSAKCEAIQSVKGLLIGADAEINFKPELLIENDDVVARHGAAVGSLQPSELFYMQTRGIPKDTAEEILCKGFAREVVEQIEIVDIAKLIESRMDEWFANRELV